MSRVRVAARALRHKFRLLSAFGTVWPAAVRGGKLLACGRFHEFGRRLFNEMDDVRAMTPAPREPARGCSWPVTFSVWGGTTTLFGPF